MWPSQTPPSIRSSLLVLALLPTLAATAQANVAGEYHDVRLDALHDDPPAILIGVAGGGAVLVYDDGEAIHYRPDGGQRTLTLPVRVTPRVLAPPSISPPRLFFEMLPKPHYRPSSPFTAVFESMPDVIPWDQRTTNGEYIRPWPMRVRLRDHGFFAPPVEYLGAEVEQEATELQLVACEQGLLFSDGRFVYRAPSVGSSFARVDTIQGSGSQVVGCDRASDGSLTIELSRRVEAETLVRRIRTDGRPMRGDQRSPRDDVSAEHAGGSCQAVAPGGEATAYMWSSDGGVVTLSVSSGGGRRELARIGSGVELACQRGGPGIYAAGHDGLHLFAPASASLGRPDGAAARARLDAIATGNTPFAPPAPYASRSPRESLIPDRVHLLFTWNAHDINGRDEHRVGDSLVLARDYESARRRFRFEVNVQWDFGYALTPPPTTGGGVAALADIPTQIELAMRVSPTVPPAPHDLRGTTRVHVEHALARRLVAAAPSRNP